MSRTKPLIALGTMTGTSMDGIDVAAIETNGSDVIRPLGHRHCPYPVAFQKQLKAAEAMAHQQQGVWQDDALEHALTEYHIQALDQLMRKLSLDYRDVDVIGFHGQTLYHAPDQQKTLQIGVGSQIASHTGVRVVEQFRLADVAHGGMGAPLAPVYHQALIMQEQRSPAAVINCGGIANISLVTGAGWDALYASDVGPGCVLVDRFVREYSEGTLTYDCDGLWAMQGRCQPDVYQRVASLNAKKLTWPVAFDSYDFALPDTTGLSPYDVCASLAHYTAQTALDALLAQCDVLSVDVSSVILCGGGWSHPVIRHVFENALPNTIRCKHADDLGWVSSAVEAQIFAYIAVRTLLGLPSSGPLTTGVVEPTVCGRII